MSNLVYGLLALVGGATVVVGTIYLLAVVTAWLSKVHRVAKDYHKVVDARWYDDNSLQSLVTKMDTSEKRMYRAEREADNAVFRIECHIKDNKHTRTAKAVKRDKERKRIEKESRS